MTIGQRIRERRIELNMTQEELAKRMGYTSKSTVCKVETDTKENITTDRLERFAVVLKTNISYLMGWSEEKEDRITENATHIAKALSKMPESDLTDNILRSIKADTLKLTDNDYELLSYYKELESEDKKTLFMCAVDLNKKDKPVICTDRTEKEIIKAYRQTSEEMKQGVCRLLGVKGDFESKTESVIEG